MFPPVPAWPSGDGRGTGPVGFHQQPTCTVAQDGVAWHDPEAETSHLALRLAHV